MAPPVYNRDDRIAIVLLGHGSREAEANSEFERLTRDLRELTDSIVLPAYVELVRPALSEALERAAAISSEVVVVPCFLFTAGHIKTDLPLELHRARRRHPNTRFSAAPALGIHPAMAAAAVDRLNEISQPDQPHRTIIVIGRGSSDPDANGDFVKLVRLIHERAGCASALPAFAGVTRPSFAEALDLAARTRPEQILVLPYFLFGGRLISQLQTQLAEFASHHSWIKTTMARPLGLHRSVLEVLQYRLNESRSGVSPLPCDNCQYRVQISPLINNVGGLKALLWSVRHMETHGQAMPHLHAHRAMRKHVLICGNTDCASRGSISLLGTLRRRLKEAGQAENVRVTKTSCMGRCGEGPAMAIYPDGIWYRGVTVSDVSDLISEHLINDRLVARLVDTILQ